MARINSIDPLAPTLSPSAVRVLGGQIIEADGSAAGEYTIDLRLPAYAVLLDIIIHNEEVWDAGTDADMVVGIYTSADQAISTVTDADEIFTSCSLKATDLTKGQSIMFESDARGGVAGGFFTEGSTSHRLDIVADDERFIRISVTTTGSVGTLGETYVYLLYAAPEMVSSTFTAT